MKLKDTIKHDIIRYFISEMNKDITKIYLSNIKYGFYSYKCEIDYDKEDKNNLGYIEIKLKSENSSYGENIFTVNVIKNVEGGFWFLKKELTEYEKLQNELFDLFIRRREAKRREAEIKENEKLLSGLPPEKRKNIVREQKLERIIED
jgi:hypothetical protein